MTHAIELSAQLRRTHLVPRLRNGASRIAVPVLVHVLDEAHDALSCTDKLCISSIKPSLLLQSPSYLLEQERGRQGVAGEMVSASLQATQVEQEQVVQAPRNYAHASPRNYPTASGAPVQGQQAMW